MQGCSKSKETRGGDAIELKNKRGKGGCRGPEFQREQVWGGGLKTINNAWNFLFKNLFLSLKTKSQQK